MHILDISLTAKQKDLLKKIEAIFSELQSKRPLNQDELRELKKWFDVSYTYHSNAIEGNTLTLAETKLVLEDGITVGGKQMREIFEAQNHKKVLDLIYTKVENKEELTEELVLFFHKHLLENILEESAGKYREIQVFISGSEEVLPKASELNNLMGSLFSWYKSSQHPVIIKAILLQYYFVKIHPFLDGNGRIARFLLNYELLQSGCFPIVIPIIRRLEYIRSIQNVSDFVDCLLDVIYEMQKTIKE